MTNYREIPCQKESKHKTGQIKKHFKLYISMCPLYVHIQIISYIKLLYNCQGIIFAWGLCLCNKIMYYSMFAYQLPEAESRKNLKQICKYEYTGLYELSRIS